MIGRPAWYVPDHEIKKAENVTCLDYADRELPIRDYGLSVG